MRGASPNAAVQRERAYVSIRQHTSAYVSSMRGGSPNAAVEREREHLPHKECRYILHINTWQAQQEMEYI
jgi:hypothetical protein